MKKENFTIEGTIALKKAFVEDGGFGIYNQYSIEYPFLVSGSEGFSGCPSNYELHFKLPEQWNEAMEYAKSYFATEFKVGDWIVILNNQWGAPIDSCVKITTVRSNNKSVTYTYNNISMWESGFGNFRHATLEEIETAQKKKETTIEMSNGAFKVNVTGKGIFHETNNITDFVSLLTGNTHFLNGCYSGYFYAVKDIIFSSTGCQNHETTLSEWKKVWEEYQRIKN